MINCGEMSSFPIPYKESIFKEDVLGMSEMMSIVLEERKETGKEVCKKMRPAGYVPCVFYGPEYVKSVPAKVKTAGIAKLLKSGQWETVTFDATLPDGKKEMCLIREVQKDFLNGDILHIDFMQLIKGHKISVNVPLHITGRETCKGVKLGGVVDQILREISMEVLPGQIPDSFTVDISSLGLGEQIHVRDLSLPSDATLLVDKDDVAVAIIIPRGVVEAEAEEEQKEVEVVAKGKAKSAGEE